MAMSRRGLFVLIRFSMLEVSDSAWFLQVQKYQDLAGLTFSPV
jgi:hypothetical protein